VTLLLLNVVTVVVDYLCPLLCCCLPVTLYVTTCPGRCDVTDVIGRYPVPLSPLIAPTRSVVVVVIGDLLFVALLDDCIVDCSC